MAHFVSFIRSVIYELAEDSKGEVHPLVKQQNRDIPAVSYNIYHANHTTYNELVKHTPTEIFKKITAEPLKTSYAYPLNKDKLDTPYDFAVISGIMVDHYSVEDQPIVVPPNATQEEIAQARAEHHKKLVRYVPFMLAVPESDELMFSISVEYMPVGAVARYKENEPPKETDPVESVPLGIDPNMPFLQPDSIAKQNAIRTAIETQLEEATKANGGKPNPDAPIDWQRVAKDAGFESLAKMNDFTKMMEQAVNATVKAEKNQGLNPVKLKIDEE